MVKVTIELQHALTEAQLALEEHNRLKVLELSLAASRADSVAECGQAAAARDAAQADAMLAAPDDQAVRKRLSAAGTRAQEADAVLNRTESALRALPGKLAEVDARLEATSAALKIAAAPVHSAALDSLSTEFRIAVDHVATIARRAYALADAGVSVSRQRLDEIKIDPCGGYPLLTGGRTYAGEDLALAWRDDPEAAALSAALEPLKSATDRLEQHLRRIGLDREKALIAANRRAHDESFAPGRRPPSPPTLVNRAPSQPPAQRFMPSTTSIPPSSPQEASILHARAGGGSSSPADPAWS